MIRTCPVCFRADDVAYQRLPDQQVAYTCTGRHPDGQPFEWVRPQMETEPSWTASEGVTDELLDPMLECVESGDDLLEYGIVEYRFRQRHPDLFRVHVAERGHVLIGRTQATASAVRFAMALGRLARRGDLAFVYGAATGAWSYNGQISYWCRPPAEGRPKITWVDFCVAIGRSPEWTAEDRRAATSN